MRADLIVNKKALKRIAYIYLPFALFVYMSLWLTGILTQRENDYSLDLDADFRSYIPVVYNDIYNIEFFGLEAYHPFDSVKPRRVHAMLNDKLPDISKKFITAKPVLPDLLRMAHTDEYLASIRSSWALASITELGFLRFFPSNLAENLILVPMKYQVGGSLLAAKAALQHGWAINLGGGFHHASRERGEGFCAIADISLIIEYLRSINAAKKFMIIDLDAHQGNGHSRDFTGDHDVFILDAYNREIYPDDAEARKGITKDIPLPAFVSDAEYFDKVLPAIDESVGLFQPEMIIYIRK